ncbi:MAG: hypothetical protein JKY96_03725 [Phycisphaerales bacterium]|nr:hypothetical protein [Phycisphaerales bacterium]
MPYTIRSVRIVTITVLGSLVAPVAMSGCQLFSEKLTADPGPAYPETIARGQVFDVQVFRDVDQLIFTNTTPVGFGPSVVWLNKRFSSPIASIAAGETITMDLHFFVDQWGETYRTGGFFAQRDPAPVVLVELETAENQRPVMHGFVIVENIFN